MIDHDEDSSDAGAPVLEGLLTTAITADLLRGAIELEATENGLLPHRLPARARAQCADGQLAMAESQSCGVRLVFRTRATCIELDTLRTKVVFPGIARPDGVYDVFVDRDLARQASSTAGHVRTIDVTNGSVGTQPGPFDTLRFPDLPDRVKDIEIWLPHNEITELVALRTNAPVAPVADRGAAVWVHHGSSISQGSNAVSPSTTWPALAASRGGVELVNLGLSGSAMLDPFTARAMRDHPADVISVKIGLNNVNGDVMRLRAFGPAVHGFLDTIREGHPTTPLLVVSPLLCPIFEDTPGPATIDVDALKSGTIRYLAAGDPAERGAGRLTLSVVRDELARIVRQRVADDPNLHYLDGRDLYGAADFAELPLPDQLHPDVAAHHRVGQRFAEFAFTAPGPFASVSAVTG